MVSLVVIGVIFQVLSDGRFLTPFNVVAPQPDRLCALTFICSFIPDIHPTDDGYVVILLQEF